MAVQQANARRGSAWLIAAMVAVCVVMLVAFWMVRGGPGSSAGTAAEVPAEPPDIEGRITTVPKWVTSGSGTDAGEALDPDAPVSSADGAATDPARGLRGVVLVEADRSADKASVTITDKTALLIERGEETVGAVLGDLTKGTLVRVWYTGPVAESYPVQAQAGTVLILGTDR